MTHVTITDHDNINGCLDIAHLHIASLLCEHDVKVRVYDPVAMANAGTFLHEEVIMAAGLVCRRRRRSGCYPGYRVVLIYQAEQTYQQFT